MRNSEPSSLYSVSRFIGLISLIIFLQLTAASVYLYYFNFYSVSIWTFMITLYIRSKIFILSRGILKKGTYSS
jgi:hypothetical protein